MKPMREFLRDLQALGIQLWDDDGYLGYRAPDGVFTPGLITQVKERKDEILHFLRNEQGVRSPASIGSDASCEHLSLLIEAYQAPHEHYHAMQAKDSIYYDAQSRSWLVTSHAAVTQILKDARFSAELNQATAQQPKKASSRRETLIQKQIIFTEGEVHQKFQGILLRKMGQICKEIPDQVRATAETLLDQVQEKETFDLVMDFAYPYSLMIIAHVLGIPANSPEQLLQLARWSDTHGHVTSSYLDVDLQDLDQLGDYFHDLLASKRQDPSDDLINTLIEAELFEHEDELIANCLMVLSAGRMTTAKVLANGIPLLLNQWQMYRTQLAEDPKLAERLTEELLRVITPTRYVTRHALEDVDLSGQFPGDHLIRQDDKVVLFLEAANHDPNRFPEPEQIDAKRHPNRHVAFGVGPHYCPGARLARMEIQIALKSLFTVFTELYSAPEAVPVWNTNPNLGGYDEYCLTRRME
ncbi:MAG: cytochrome P450 [Chloroflexota bacterium]